MSDGDAWEFEINHQFIGTKSNVRRRRYHRCRDLLILPVQFTPSPLYPLLQVQLKVPSRFVQLALS